MKNKNILFVATILAVPAQSILAGARYESESFEYLEEVKKPLPTIVNITYTAKDVFEFPELNLVHIVDPLIELSDQRPFQAKAFVPNVARNDSEIVKYLCEKFGYAWRYGVYPLNIAPIGQDYGLVDFDTSGGTPNLRFTRSSKEGIFPNTITNELTKRSETMRTISCFIK